jgi:RecB family exonuclease
MSHAYVAELPRHLSFSQVSNLLQCGERFRLTRVWGIQEQPGWALIGGSAVHEWTELFDKNSLGSGLPVPTFEEVFHRLTLEAETKSGIGRDQFKASGRASKAFPDKETAAWWLQEGPSMCRSWVTFRQNAPLDIWIDPQGKPGIELACRLRVEDGHTEVVMYIDRVMVDQRTGELVVLDLKSGQPVKSDAQLGDYRIGLEQKYPGTTFRVGCFWYARTGTTSPFFPLNEYSLERAEHKYVQAKRIRDSGIFLANPGMQCGYCSVKDHCYAVGGYRAGEVRPPWVTMTDWEVMSGELVEV